MAMVHSCLRMKFLYATLLLLYRYSRLMLTNLSLCVVGVYYDIKGGTYTGNWSLSMKSGEGEFKWNNGDIYTGSFLRDKMHGEGTMVSHQADAFIVFRTQ